MWYLCVFVYVGKLFVCICLCTCLCTFLGVCVFVKVSFCIHNRVFVFVHTCFLWQKGRTVACRFGISMSSYGGIFYIRNKTTHFNLKRLISIASCGFPNNGIPPKFAKQQQPPSASFQIRPRFEEKKIVDNFDLLFSSLV